MQRDKNSMPKNWTAEVIPDLSGKVIIVTGANSGIGYEAAKEFARKGAQTILACRDMGRADQAIDYIQREIPQANLDAIQLDLGSLKSIDQFVEQFKAKYERLDVLMNNAGIMMAPYGLTEDGFERQFGINHLGHFALTGRLIDLIKSTPQARVVNISSNAHLRGEMDFDNLMFESGVGYTPNRAYGRSKLANLLFTYELQRRFEEHKIDAIAVAAHPGISNTKLADHMIGVSYLRPLVGWILQSAAMGALPGIRAAVDPAVDGGQYYGPEGRGEARGYPVLVRSNTPSHDLDDAKRLWEVSEQLTGVSYL
jgi:NAD(P)-dependent dehydrogenase (short-subunit alcohol dehydrogenase family)